MTSQFNDDKYTRSEIPWHECEHLVTQTNDFRVLVGLVNLVGHFALHRTAQDNTASVEKDLWTYDVYSRAIDLICRIGVQNEYLYTIGAYREPSPGKLPFVLNRLPRVIRKQLTELADLDSKTQHQFLSVFNELTRFTVISGYVGGRRANFLGAESVKYELFRMSLNCPALAWQGKDLFFRTFPQYLEDTWTTSSVRFAEFSNYDWELDLGEILDDEFCSAGIDFFRGLQKPSNRSIGSSGEKLRGLAHLVRGDRFSESSTGPLSSFGMKSFIDVVELLLNNTASRLRTFAYRVTASDLHKGVWILRLPVGEDCFVERTLPWTVDEYKENPLDFIRVHSEEMPRCSFSCWLLDKGDILGDLALDVGLNNSISGLAALIVRPAQKFGGEAQQRVLSAELRIAQWLDELSKLSPIQEEAVADIVAAILIEVLFEHEVTVRAAAKVAAAYMLKAILRTGSATD